MPDVSDVNPVGQAHLISAENIVIAAVCEPFWQRDFRLCPAFCWLGNKMLINNVEDEAWNDDNQRLVV